VKLPQERDVPNKKVLQHFMQREREVEILRHHQKSINCFFPYLQSRLSGKTG